MDKLLKQRVEILAQEVDKIKSGGAGEGYTKAEADDKFLSKADASTALAGKQDSLDQTQLAAVNSGIDSTKVAQIETNKTNIWYATNKVGKNELKLTGDVSNPNTISVYWNYEEGTVRITGTLATTSTVFILLGSWTAKKTGEYILASEGANSTNIYVYDDSSWNTNGSPIATWTAGTTRNLYVRIASGVVVGDVTVKPMVCLKSLYDADSSIEAYAAPNYDLTYLQAEDRAALAEVVDSGAKNLLTNKGQLSHGDVTFTWNNDGSVTVSGTKTAGAECYVNAIDNVPYSNMGLKAGDTIVLSNNGTNAYISVIFWASGSGYTSAITAVNGATPVVLPTNKTNILIRLSVKADVASVSETIKPMICTKAAFDVSQKFVPYRPSYQELYEMVLALQSTRTTTTRKTTSKTTKTNEE